MSDRITAQDLHTALDRWFGEGHTRFVLALEGARAGRVLLAEPASPAHALTEREILSRPDGVIIERRERFLGAQELAADPVNAALLMDQIELRLAGAIAPPQICSRRPGPR